MIDGKLYLQSKQRGLNLVQVDSNRWVHATRGIPFPGARHGRGNARGLLEREALSQPLLYLSAFFEQHRSEYYDHLLTTSQHGDLEPWIRFFLEGVSRQARDSENRTVHLVELQQQMRNDLLEERRPGSVLRLAELLFAAPLVSATMAASRLGVSSPTAHAAITALEERGDLQEITGRQRHRLYEAPRIFRAVYGPIRADDGDQEQDSTR